MSDQKNSSLSSFLAGVVIGAALTYLFGTKSGRKLKDELLKEGTRVIEKMGEGLDEAKEKVEESQEEIKKKLTDKEEVAGAVVEVPKHITELQKKGRRLFFRRSHPNPES